jgi:hypothetical protein
MARFGTGINPSLGRIDYTPYMQGAIAGGQSIAQGIASLGQAAGNAIRDYKKKKEEEQNIANTISFLKTNFKKDPTTYSVFADQDGNFDEKAAEAATRSIGSNGVMSFINFTQAAQANRDVRADKEREKQIAKTVNDLLSTSDPTALQVKLAAADPEAVSRYEQSKLDRDYRKAQIELAAAQGTKLDVESTLEAQKMGQFKDPRPTPPAGFEYTSSDFGNTTMRPIPGGPAAIEAGEKAEKKSESEVKKQQAAKDANIKLEFLLRNLDKAESLVMAGAGGNIEGRVFGVLSPRTEELDTTFSAIRSALTLDEIAQLKAQSERGGNPLGPFTDRDALMVADSAAALRTTLNKEASLEKIRMARERLLRLRGSNIVDTKTNQAIAPETEEDVSLAKTFLGRNLGFRSTTR